jgi:hypothetical protein
MRQFVTRWVVALTVAVGSLAIGSASHGAVVTLNATISNLQIGLGNTDQLQFTLPNDLTSINSIQFDFTYFTDFPSVPGFPNAQNGSASLEFFFEQDTSTFPVTVFAVGGVYSIDSGLTSTVYSTPTFNVGGIGFSYTLPFLASIYQFGVLSATAPWTALAGGNIAINAYNGGDGGFTDVFPLITAATMTLNYNSTSGGVVPEPSTLAIALVGLAGWRGRRMLRRS